MALIGDQVYVANADSVVRFPYRTGDTRNRARAASRRRGRLLRNTVLISAQRAIRL
jgi:glucose/arabinose dehydrogenase